MRLRVALPVLVLSFAALGLGKTCPGALGDGLEDDGHALQSCLGDGPDAGESIELLRGATYIISRTLHPRMCRWLSGGAAAEGALTTIRCAGELGPQHRFRSAALEVAGELEIRGLHLDNCFWGIDATGNLTLVDSTIADSFEGVNARNGRVKLQRSRVIESYRGITMGGNCRVVLRDGSDVARCKFGVVIDRGTADALPELELHSSVIRDSRQSAIIVHTQARLLLSERSSLQNSSGPCVLLTHSRGVLVTLAGASWLGDCGSGIKLEGGESNVVLLQGGSWISTCFSAVVFDGGKRNEATIEGGSSIWGSHEDGVIVVGHGSSHRVNVSGASWIEGSGGSGIRVEQGYGHRIAITGNSFIRDNQNGVLLAAKAISLTLESSAIRENRGSAVLVRAPRFAAGTYCSRVSLLGAYLVHNGQGFQCSSTCVVGEVSGVFYFNGVDVNNSCSGSLSSLRDALSGTRRFAALRAAILWCTVCLAIALASLPWLQAFHVCCWPKSSPQRFPVIVALGGAALCTPLFHVWVERIQDLQHVMQHLKQDDLEEEGVVPLFAFAVLAPVFVISASLIVSRWWLRRWRAAQVLVLLRALEESLWQGDSAAEGCTRGKLEASGFSPAEVQDRVQQLRRRHSQEAGVSVAYLLSMDFLELARARTGLENPTFLQMKEPFWQVEDAIGKDVLCPRDGRPGCALVDTSQTKHRQRCTHFLSWVWRYPLLLVREALQIWAEEEELDPSSTFVFMCFFVNNQFRILVEGTGGGADDLETTFERNLQRIGRVVALLDHWQESLYLSRIWTIYEQYVAAKLQLPVTVILNQAAGESLVVELDKGKDGIVHIAHSLCRVHSEMAEASVKADEEHVKALIRSTIGFEYVDQRVRYSMTDWVASVVRRHMDCLVESTKEGGWPAEPAHRRGLVRRVSCTPLRGIAGNMAVLEVEGPD